MAGLTPDEERHLARQSRLVALVIAVTAVLWIAANWLGPMLGMDGKYAVLFDLMALAGFVWALVVTGTIWRKRRQN